MGDALPFMPRPPWYHIGNEINQQFNITLYRINYRLFKRLRRGVGISFFIVKKGRHKIFYRRFWIQNATRGPPDRLTPQFYVCFRSKISCIPFSNILFFSKIKPPTFKLCPLSNTNVFSRKLLKFMRRPVP